MSTIELKDLVTTGDFTRVLAEIAMRAEECGLQFVQHTIGEAVDAIEEFEGREAIRRERRRVAAIIAAGTEDDNDAPAEWLP